MERAASQRRSQSAVAACIFLFLSGSLSLAAEPWADIRVQPQERLGVLSCSAVSCHGGGGPRYWSGAAAGAEYVHWLGRAGTFREGRRHYDPRAVLESSDGDPHALAGQRMSSVRFQEVLRRASLQADGSVDAAMYQRCARCHDPGASPESGVGGRESGQRALEELPPLISPNLPAAALSQRERGISCETCHGGAKQWIAVHYQRDITRERLLELGMIDTKNLLLRARLCASCHIGSVENDMNHDMIAAGHPPLRFELASYEALIGTKHWDDRPQRAAEPEYEVQLWAAGRIAAAEAALAVLEGRAKRAEDTRQGAGDRGQHEAPWPEFAEGNCFACHQPLRSVAGQPSPSRSSGAIAWQSWNLAMLNSVVTTADVATGELPPAAIGSSLSRLRAAMEGSIEPPPAQIAELASAARAVLRSAPNVDLRGRILDRDGYPLQIRAAVAAATSANAIQNWEETCQQVAALAAARRAVADQTGDQHTELQHRLLIIAKLLRFQRPDREWPTVFAGATTAPSSAMKMDEIRSDLEAIRAALRQAALQIRSHP